MLFKSTRKDVPAWKSFHGYSITSNSDKNSVSGNVMYPFDLKNAGATRAEMLAFKNNDAGECVCLLWCDDKSRVACKSAPPLFFLFFGQFTFFFFFFSFLQCFWPCPVFFLQGPMLSWKVIIWIVLLNLHGATRSTRSCNKRASLSAWLSFFLQHVGQHRSKNDHDEEIKSQIFYWSCFMYAYCCERQRRKFQALRETKNTWNFFVAPLGRRP